MKKGLFTFFAAAGLAAGSVQAQNVTVQVIHNSADSAAQVVTVFATGLGSTTTLLDSFAYRTATGLVNLQPGMYRINIAPGVRAAITDTIFGVDLDLVGGMNYLLVAHGTVSAGYSPVRPFNVAALTSFRTSSSGGNTDVVVFHGATDAPTVDVIAGGNTLIDNLPYGQFSAYQSLPTSDYELTLADSTGTNVINRYNAPLQTLGLSNASIVVLASGFVTPANNANGPAFGLFVALTTGGALVPLSIVTALAQNNQIDLGLRSFPNPARHQMQVELNLEQTEDVMLSVYDMQGRLVAVDQIQGATAGPNNYTLQVGGLAQGMYVLAASTQKGIQTTKFEVIK